MMNISMKFLALLASALFLMMPSQGFAKINVGVYYFPGWSVDSSGAWEKIKPYPEREPYLGWYEEGDPAIARKQLHWMREYGIDFVIYDWYWKNENPKGIWLNKAIDAYLSIKQTAPAVKFSILYANHTGTPSSLAQFDEIVQYWCQHYFNNPNFVKIDGRPVVYIFSPGQLRVDSAKFGMTANGLIARAKKISKKLIGSEIYFVGITQALAGEVQQVLPSEGYDALSAYNYHYGLAGTYDKKNPPVSSSSYNELTADYRKSWKWILENSKLPYFVPVTSGWDKRPWGGSKAPFHDNSTSTPESFSRQITAAREILEEYAPHDQKTMVVCCWNEYGEGSYIEPTKKWGFQYLMKLRSVNEK